MGELNIDIGLTGTGNTMKKDGVGLSGVDLFDGAFLGGIEWIICGYLSLFLGIFGGTAILEDSAR